MDATPASVPLQHVPTDEAELLRTELRDCLAHVGSVLARAEATLSKLQDVSVVSSLPDLKVGSAEEGEAGLYGDFSPCPRL